MMSKSYSRIEQAAECQAYRSLGRALLSWECKMTQRERDRYWQQLHPADDTKTVSFRKGVLGLHSMDLQLEPGVIRVTNVTFRDEELAMKLAKLDNHRLASLTKVEGSERAQLMLIDQQVRDITNMIKAHQQNETQPEAELHEIK